MKKIIAGYTKGFKKSLVRLNTQQKGILVIATMIVVTGAGFLVMDTEPGSISLTTNPVPGQPFAVWPAGNYLDFNYPHYGFDGINNKHYCIPLVVTWMADNGIKQVKIRAQKEELFSTYHEIFSGFVDWGDATSVTVAYPFSFGVATDARSVNVKVKLYMTDKRGNEWESGKLSTTAKNYLDYQTLDSTHREGKANDPAVRINYEIWSASLNDPDPEENPIPDVTQTPPGNYVPPPPPSGSVGIEDLFIISGLAVTAVVLHKKKRKLKIEA